MFTLGRNSLNVRSVVKASVRVHVFKPIRESTLEKNHTDVIYVVRTSVTVHVLHTIRKFTLEKSFRYKKCVSGICQNIHLQVFGESMIMTNPTKLLRIKGNFFRLSIFLTNPPK